MPRHVKTEYPSAAVRIRVLKRDKFTCTYCGVSGSEAELETDHIIPVSKGGSHHMSNLTTACRSCNQDKGAGEGPRRARPPVHSDPLVGKFIHILKDGKINNQGHIVGREGSRVLVQLFSWASGCATNIVVKDVDFVLSEECVLYPGQDEMNYAWKKSEARERDLERRERRA